MAKKPKDNDDSGITYFGEAIDPDIQKKVDDYMELEDEVAGEADSIPDEPQVDLGGVGVRDPEVESAPLLPTDKLPDDLKADKSGVKKSTKVAVLHADELVKEVEDAGAIETDAGGIPGDTPGLNDEAEIQPAAEEADLAAAEELVQSQPAKKPNSKKIMVAHDEDPEENVGPDVEPSEEPAIDSVDAPVKADENVAQGELEPQSNKINIRVDESENSSADREPTVDDDAEASDVVHLADEEIEALSDEQDDDEEFDQNATVGEYLDDLEANDEPKAPLHQAQDLTDFVPKESSTINSSIPMDDAVTSQAIADIMATDSDTLLGIEDKNKKEAPPLAVEPKKKKSKAKRPNIFKLLFTKPLYRNSLIAAILLGIGAVAAVPVSRYYMLNAAGVRVSTSLKVLDEKTSLPLKNVEVTVDGKSSKTDGDGNVSLSGIRLGRQEIVVKKPAFAELKKTHVLGWGSNPLGDYRIAPTGIQYSFKLIDWLSERPIAGGEVSYGEAVAKISEKGEAVLTLPAAEETTITVDIKGDNYRIEKQEVKTTAKDQIVVKLVPSKKHVFVSKQSGKYDLYSVDVDGKNEEVLVSGSGVEKPDSLGIALHPKKNMVAYTASRENTRNQDGFVLTTLYMVDLESKEIKKVTQSERIQIIDWIGDRFVYVKVAQGASEATPDRNRLVSYDLESGQEKELASTNYFNDVISAGGALYYSPAQYQVTGSVGLYKINADGSNKKTIFQKEVWNLFRTSFDKLSLSVGQDWYELTLANDSLTKVGGAPSVLKSRVYVPDSDGKRNLWIDERDGKTVLMNYQTATKSEQPLITQSGIRNPVRWLDDGHIIYRVSDGQETADYVYSINGSDPKKIRDVTNTAGIDRWYYF